MTATVYALRPFQSAAQQARRAGVPVQKAIAEVLDAQRRGELGNQVAGKYRAMAFRAPQGPAPKGAA
jgi:hypothetical protein